MVVSCICVLFYAAWKQWNIAYKQFNVANKDASSTEVVNEYVTEDTIDPETVAYLKRNQGTCIYVCMHELLL